jgi:large subunit ribosomal protein L24
MAKQNFHVKKGDQVTVTSGNHKGSSGKILAVLPKKSQVLIEGVRLIKKHTKKSQDSPQGAIIQREGPIHISNVKRVEEAEATSKSATTKTKSKKKEKAS